MQEADPELGRRVQLSAYVKPEHGARKKYKPCSPKFIAFRLHQSDPPGPELPDGISFRDCGKQNARVCSK